LSEEEPTEKNKTAENPEASQEHQPPSLPFQGAVVSSDSSATKMPIPAVDRNAEEEAYKRRQMTLMERQARAAERLNCISAWAAGVGVVAMLILIGTLLVTKQSADTAQKQLDMSERPWVGIDRVEPVSPLNFDRTGGHLSLSFYMTNFGHSPARDIRVIARLVPLPLDKDHWDFAAEQKALCVSFRYLHDENGWAVTTIFPNSNDVVRYPPDVGANIAPDEIKKATMYPVPKQTLNLIYLLGCIDYRFTYSEDHHQTGFAYMVTPKNLSISGKEFTPIGSYDSGSLQLTLAGATDAD
jgi:hypothetical protein